MERIENVNKFLISTFPQSDSILIGCQIDGQIVPHECCEYDIISIYDKEQLDLYGNILKNDYKVVKEGKNTYEVLILSIQDFQRNPKIHYTDFIHFPGGILKKSAINYFQKKSEDNPRDLTFLLKKSIINNIYEITNLIDLLSRGKTDNDLISFYLKRISFNTLKNFINFYIKKSHRPSHLKFQINQIKENQDLKTKEKVDALLEFIGIERSNISTITRSEKSLKFLVRNYREKNDLKIMFDKLDFFKKKSMYVDGNLFIHNYIHSQSYDWEFIRNYNNLLNYIADIETKEKITMLKEANLLLEFNKKLL